MSIMKLQSNNFELVTKIHSYSQKQTIESMSPIHERISKVLSEWTALQMAIENEWGGRDSLEKSEQLKSDVLSWLFHSNALLEEEDLENLLHERLLLTFNTEVEDDSIEEVAEQLISLRNEHL